MTDPVHQLGSLAQAKIFILLGRNSLSKKSLEQIALQSMNRSTYYKSIKHLKEKGMIQESNEMVSLSPALPSRKDSNRLKIVSSPMEKRIEGLKARFYEVIERNSRRIHRNPAELARIFVWCTQPDPEDPELMRIESIYLNKGGYRWLEVIERWREQTL